MASALPAHVGFGTVVGMPTRKIRDAFGTATKVQRQSAVARRNPVTAASNVTGLSFGRETSLWRFSSGVAVSARKTHADALFNDIDRMPFTACPFLEWIESHKKEMAKHAGKFVVIDAARGIVDSGDDPFELETRWKNDAGQPMLTFVSPLDYAGA